MAELKISIIGTGHLGSIHTKLLKNNQYAKLEGIYDIDTGKVQKLSNEYSCRAFTSLSDLLNNSDAVIIAAPTSMHYEIAIQCIEKGIHCFIEKPITTTFNEAKEIIALAKSKKVLVQVGHVERFNPALMALRDYEFAPKFIEAHRLSQFKPRATDVSVVLDLMIHDIDIMLWLVKSKVSRIDANGVAVLTDTPDIANARITFENGAVANLTASRISANPMRKMRFFQQNSYISMDFGKQDVEVFKIIEDTEEMPTGKHPTTMLGTIEAGLKNKNIIFEKPQVPEINAIAEEQKAFAEAILNNAPVAVSAEEAAEALRIAELISEQID